MIFELFCFFTSVDKIALNGNVKDLEAKGVPEDSGERSSVFAVFKKVNLSPKSFTVEPWMS